MNTQRILDVARDSVKAFNARDFDRFRELLAPNSVYDEVGTDRRLTGRDEIIQALEGWTDAFPDVKGTIEHSAASDDTAVLEVTFEGTHDGELTGPTGTVAPTGNPVRVRCAQLIRVADGMIVENRNYFDMLGMLQAVGAIPTTAARKAGA